MTFTGIDRLTRMWQPAAEALVPVAEIERRKAVKRAIGEDGIVRLDALPNYLSPFTLQWFDTGTVSVQINLPIYRLPVPCQLVAVHAHIFTPPTGQPMLLEISNLANETLAELSIATSANYGSVEGLEVDLNAGTWIQQVTMQVGSGTAGSNLSVVALFQPEAE